MLKTAPKRGGQINLDVRATLREATEEVHEALHRHPVFEDLLAGSICRARYAALLSRFHLYHASTTQIAAAADAALGHPPAGRDGSIRLDALEADLADLGASALPALELVVPRGPAWNIGFSYVLRGSALGGRVLHRALDRLFEADEGGRRFFRGPVGSGRSWRAFCQRLEAYDFAVATLDEAVVGAAAAFTHFRYCLERA